MLGSKTINSQASVPMLNTSKSYGTRQSEMDHLLPTIREEYDAGRPRRMAYISLVTFLFTLFGIATVLIMKPLANSAQYDSRYSRFDQMNREAKHKHDDTCDDGDYSKRTLERAYELPFAALFKDKRGQKKFEASDVIIVNDDVYAVCDSSWAISKFGDTLQPFSPDNIQIGDPNREEEDSGYEALFHDNGIFYVVRESVDLLAEHRKAQSYHAIIEELDMGTDDYEVVATCPAEYEFEGDSKGFEGAVAIRDLDHSLIVLGLCEGNYCSESYKDDTGHGRIIVMKKVVDKHGECSWETIKEIDIPSSANFRDYSAITMDRNGRVAISSQEDSQLWIGHMVGRNDDGRWDVDALDFAEDDGVVYDFPRNDKCEIVYCNIEGVHWIDDNMIMAVSDKMKSKGKQHFRCFEKDQSVHAFVLP